MSRPSATTSDAASSARHANRQVACATTRKKSSRAQQLGFSLRDIRELLALGERSCAQTRAVAERRLADIETRLLDLASMRRTLARLIRRCQAGEEPACPIVRSLSDARTD